MRVPRAVLTEFGQHLDAATARAARRLAQALTQSPNQIHNQEITMKSKRTPTTKRAELAPTTTPKPTAKPAAKKVTKATQKSSKTSKPSDRAKIHAAYTSRKLQVQKRVKLNAMITYHGRNELLDGKSVKVVGYESRGGIIVEFKVDKHVVSPHALLKKSTAKEV